MTPNCYFVPDGFATLHIPNDYRFIITPQALCLSCKASKLAVLCLKYYNYLCFGLASIKLSMGKTVSKTLCLDS